MQVFSMREDRHVPAIEPPYMATVSGNRIYLTGPSSFDIDFWEVATALAQINRFAGHTKFPYSVAQHSVLVHDHLPDHLKIYGLLHDAHEAYTGDVTTPTKAAIGWLCPAAIDTLHDIQNRLDEAIWDAAGVPPLSGHRNEYAVKEADRRAYVTESMALRPGFALSDELPPYAGETIVEMDWRAARDLFLERLACYLTVGKGIGDG